MNCNKLQEQLAFLGHNYGDYEATEEVTIAFFEVLCYGSQNFAVAIDTLQSSHTSKFELVSRECTLYLKGI